MPVRGVLFDVDDTLVDFSGAETVALAAHLAAFGLLDAVPGGAAAALVHWREVMETHYARFLSGELTFDGQRRARVRGFLARLGHESAGMPDGEADAWFAAYHERHQASWAAFPDAAPVLARLAPGYRLGVVSNSSAARQRRKLAHVGLLGYVAAALVCSDEHGEPKPAPGIFLAGCARLGLPPEQVAYVGDRYTVDALGAHEAGLRAFWLSRAPHSLADPAVPVLRTLHDLLPALAA
jgi:putative hydrolase of the HAD superfamily